MSPRTLRDDLREHYLWQKVPAGTLERLKAMEAATRYRRSKRARPWTFAALAAASAAVAALAWRTAEPGRHHDAGQVARRIGEEIAMNHRQLLDVEIEASSYAELRRRMVRLDFSLAEVSGLDGSTLLGARYCSIRGQLAAQLQFETDDGLTVTLYQTALTRQLESLEWAELRSGGLAIDLWQQDGLFLGMARAPAQP